MVRNNNKKKSHKYTNNFRFINECQQNNYN